MRQIIRNSTLLLAIATAAPCLPAHGAPQVDSNRWVTPGDIRLSPGPTSFEVEVEVTLHHVTQLPAPVDLSVEMLIAVNGGVVANVPVILSGPIGGGGGYTCGISSCPGTCPNGVACVDLSSVGGMGCTCDNPVSPGTSILALVPRRHREGDPRGRGRLDR